MAFRTLKAPGSQERRNNRREPSDKILDRESNMISSTRLKQAVPRIAAFAALTIFVCQTAMGQQAAPANWTAEQDHQNMMEQLGIKALRAGPSGNEKDPNHANYDEEKANTYGDLPDALTLKDGQKVTSAKQWWDQRRPEIVEASLSARCSATHLRPMCRK